MKKLIIISLLFIFSCAGIKEEKKEIDVSEVDIIEKDLIDFIDTQKEIEKDIEDFQEEKVVIDVEDAEGIEKDVKDVQIEIEDIKEVDEEIEEITQKCPSKKEGEVLFKFEADGEISSTPAIGDDGTIYFGTKKALFYAVDCNGNKKWEWKYECSEPPCPQAFEGSPAIGKDGTIYIGDDIAIPNYFFALTKDGELKWKYETEFVYGQMDASPAIADDGVIYVGSHGVSGYSGPIGQLIALNPQGKILKGFPISTKAIKSSPAISNEILFVGETGSMAGPWGSMVNSILAVNKEGKILWETELSSTGKDISLSSIAIDKDGKIFVAENHHGEFPDVIPFAYLIEIEPQSGKKILEVQVSSTSLVVGSPVIGKAFFGEDVIVALWDGHLVSANPQSGGKIVTFDINIGLSGDLLPINSTPLLGDDGFIYAAGHNPTMSSPSYAILKISKDGVIKEVYPALSYPEDEITSSLQMGNGGVIYFGTKEGKLFAIQSGAKGLDKNAPWPTFRHDEKNSGNAGLTCNETKINFTQKNEKSYDFYEVCVPKGLEDFLEVLKSIDPSIYCGVKGVFAGCDKDKEIGCHGDLEYKENSKEITEEKWKQICEISSLDFVSKIGGGHWVE